MASTVLIGGYFSPEIVSVMEKPSCVFCEYLLHSLEEMLKDDKTREKIETALDNICKVMPNSLEVTRLGELEGGGA